MTYKIIYEFCHSFPFIIKIKTINCRNIKRTFLKKTFLFVSVFYLFAAAIIFPYVRWYADNPDTFQYLAIASKYLSGDWLYAVNGYWSPMISWLLIIPLFFINDQLFAFKILQVLIGLFTIWQWTKLLDKTSIQKSRKNILAYVLIPFVLVYALLNATPDLLFMGLLLMLINQILSEDIFTNANRSIQAGITGALLYLTKGFGFPFFIALTLIIILFEWCRKEKNKIVWTNVFRLYVMFFIICCVWIIALSLHYGHFTISEAASFNMSRDAAPLPGRSAGLPVLNKGLYSPLAHSYSAWETPGEYVSKERVTLFNSKSDYLKIIKRNLLSIYYFDFSHQAGFLFLFLLFLFLFLKGIKELFKERWRMILLIFIFLFYGGYTLILVHSRYTWINSLLMLILSAYFIQTIFYKRSLKYISTILFVLIILLSVKRPVKEILFSSDSDYPVHWVFNSLKHPFVTMWIFYRSDIELQRVIKDVKAKKILKGNIASLKIKGLDRDPYSRSLQIVQNSGGRYYGQLDNEMEIKLQEDELKKMSIDYLITWKNTKWGNELPVYYNEGVGIKIYFLR